MLDPLTALGVASSIAQLIDFSKKTVDLAAEVYHEGSSAKVLRLKVATASLVERCGTIDDRTRTTLSSAASLTREEKVRLTTNHQQEQDGSLKCC